jgi:hypothetical protein
MGGVFNYVNLHVYHYAGNNPIKLVDPDGEYIESGWDIASLVIGVGNLAASIHEGDPIAIAIDVAGLAADIVAAALPGVPGGAGAAIKSARSAANIVSDVAGVAGGAYSAAKAVQQGDSRGVGLGIASAATPALGRAAGAVFEKAADANKAFVNTGNFNYSESGTFLKTAGNILEGTATGINTTVLGRSMHQNLGNQQTPTTNRTGSSAGLDYGPGTGRSSPPHRQPSVNAQPVVRPTSPVMNY